MPSREQRPERPGRRGPPSSRRRLGARPASAPTVPNTAVPQQAALARPLAPPHTPARRACHRSGRRRSLPARSAPGAGKPVRSCLPRHLRRAMAAGSCPPGPRSSPGSARPAGAASTHPSPTARRGRPSLPVRPGRWSSCRMRVSSPRSVRLRRDVAKKQSGGRHPDCGRNGHRPTGAGRPSPSAHPLAGGPERRQASGLFEPADALRRRTAPPAADHRPAAPALAGWSQGGARFSRRAPSRAPPIFGQSRAAPLRLGKAAAQTSRPGTSEPDVPGPVPRQPATVAPAPFPEGSTGATLRDRMHHAKLPCRHSVGW